MTGLALAAMIALLAFVWIFLDALIIQPVREWLAARRPSPPPLQPSPEVSEDDYAPTYRDAAKWIRPDILRDIEKGVTA